MKCKSCARFPFCTVQELCIHNAKDLTKAYVDYYIKRKRKQKKLVEKDGLIYKFEDI